MLRSWSSVIRCALLSIGLPLGLSSVASAADETPSAVSPELGEVVVTATRREAKLNDVPESVSVLSGDTLQVLGDAGDDIKQLASKVPSLYIESSNGRAFPRFYIRGYGNTDFHDFASQPVGLVYDDIVQENPALKGFPIFDQADVEVLRGPQGTLFGRNSPAGVVKLESAKPVLNETSGFFSLSDATFNSSVIQGVANLPINDQMAFRASVQSQHRDDWINDPINNSKLGGYSDTAARLQLLYKPTDEFTVLLNIHGRDLTGSSTVFRANSIQPGTNQLIPGFQPAAYYADGPNSASLQTYGANVHLTWALPNVSLQSITGYETISHYLSVGDIDGGCGATFNPSTQCNAVFPTGAGPGYIPFAVQTSAGLKSHEQFTQEFRAVSTNEGPFKAQAGLFVFYENVTAADDDYCAPGECDPTSPLAAPFALQDTTVSKQKNDAEAVFGSLDYTPIEAFTATAGIRYTEDHRSFNAYYIDFVPPTSNQPTAPLGGGISKNNVSWDVSANYKLDPDVSLYARVATGFRAPSFGEPAAGLPIQFAKAETTRSYEAGVKADLLEHRARIALDGFYYDVSNQQITAVGGATNGSQLLNAEHTIGYGSELDIEARPMPHLTLNVSGSLNITRIQDPGLTVAVGGSVPAADILNPNTGVAGEFGTTYYARIDGNPLPQAAKWISDVSLRYDIPLNAGGDLYVYTDWSYRSGVNLFLYEAREYDAPSLTQGGLRLGYTWGDGKYDAAVFCRNCTNQVHVIGAIDFDNLTSFVNDPRVAGAQIRVKF